MDSPSDWEHRSCSSSSEERTEQNGKMSQVRSKGYKQRSLRNSSHESRAARVSSFNGRGEEPTELKRYQRTIIMLMMGIIVLGCFVLISRSTRIGSPRVNSRMDTTTLLLLLLVVVVGSWVAVPNQRTAEIRFMKFIHEEQRLWPGVESQRYSLRGFISHPVYVVYDYLLCTGLPADSGSVGDLEV